MNLYRVNSIPYVQSCWQRGGDSSPKSPPLWLRHCKAFLEAYCESSDNENDVPILECTEGTVKFSSSWLLKQLLTHLHSHMQHKCVHRKFGIILFRKGGDLLTSLSWALGRAHTCSETTYTYTNNLSGNESDVTDASILCRAATIVNDILHHESAELFLSHLFTLILRHSYMPKALCDCLLIPIPKPNKDPSLSDSYRPIALAPNLSKVL